MCNEGLQKTIVWLPFGEKEKDYALERSEITSDYGPNN
jgi:hypothetical protein